MFKIITPEIVCKVEKNEFHKADTSSEYIAWLADGNTPEPADIPDPREAIRAEIDTLEKTSLLPRVTREFMLLSFATTAAGMGVDPMQNIAYQKVKELDDKIAALRARL